MNSNYKVNIKDIQNKYIFKIFCAGADTTEIEQEIGNLSNLTTTAKDNLVNAINEVDGNTTTNATAISGLQSGKEDKSNKVTSISSSSTDTQYPSAKCVYDSQTTQDETISTLETNLEETQAELDYYKTIYNVLPKVSGNGENITLDNTGESILKLDLSGQCKQDSTTGKNKFTFGAIENGTRNGVVRTIDGSKLTLNGTTTGANDTITTTDSGIELPAGTYSYTLIKNGTITLPSGGNTAFIVKDINNTQVFGGTFNSLNSSGTLTGTFTLSEATELYIQIYTNGANQVFNFDLFCQVETGSTATTYEPYTNGASPNPTYPQQIHEVSGDNTIEVCGINIWNEQWELGTYGTNGEKIVSTSVIRNKNIIKVQPNTDYKWVLPSNPIIFYYDKDKNYISQSSATAPYQVRTTPENCYYANFRMGTTYGTTYNNDITISPDTSITTYYPYNGDTYEINLGGANIFSGISSLGSGSTYENGVLTIPNATYNKSNNINVDSSTDYYLQFESTKSNTRVYIREYDNTDTQTNIITKYASSSFTTSATTTYIVVDFSPSSSDVPVSISKIMVSKGTTALPYEPYTPNPIKMRGIGTYEDYFTKNSGKQLFDKSNLQAKNVYINDTTMKFASSNATKTLYIPCEPSTTYTISKVVSSRFYVGSSVNVPSNGGDVSVQVHNNSATSLTITTGANDNYLSVFYYKSDSDTLTEQAILDSIMINEGTTALPYEPYGTGQWCKYNAIGEVVLNGSETGWGYFFSTIGIYVNSNLIQSSLNAGTINCMCNYFTATYRNKIRNNLATVDNVCSTYSAELVIANKSITSVDDFETWLSTHNTIVDYILATPYLSLIEDTTLIEQLDKLERALGKDGQTNISQVNNDAPFKIYASALREIE